MGDNRDWINVEIGNYRILRELGRGKSGVVYLAEHWLLLRLQVAMKIWHVSIDPDTQARTIFTEGVQEIVQLTHPNLVRIQDGGFVDGHPFLVMEYVPLGNLRRRCPAGSCLSPAGVAPILNQCAEALYFLHNPDRDSTDDGQEIRPSLVHGDVKPENMLIGRDTHVRLADVDGVILFKQGVTQSPAGALEYLAPEHAGGHASAASDQYSLGVVAYELLSGSLPFGRVGSSPDAGLEIMQRHMTEQPPPLPHTVPREVAEVVMRALAKKPEARFPHVRAFAAAFEQAVQRP